MNKQHLTLSLWVIVFVSSAPMLMAQSPLSKIVGTVTDASQGVVVGATVTVRNENTGYTRNAMTDERGYYEIDRLPNGSYTMDATLSGFKTFTNRNVVLETRQTLRIDVLMQVGEISEAVQVVGEAPVVATDTGQINTGHVNRRFIENNYLGQITSLYVATGALLSPSFQEYQAVGTTAAQNKTTADGVEMNNFFLNVETIQEIKVLTSGNSAEYTSPTVMDFVTQSGTNAFHGKVLFQLGNPALNALGPNTTIRGPGWPTNRQQLFAVSGPVRIPKVYNGTDKTFFYFDREWSNTTSYAQGVSPLTIPPEAMRAGDFSFLPASTYPAGALINPFTGSPFPNNQIPASMINSVSANIQKFFPATNYPASSPTGDRPNYVRDLSSALSVGSLSNLNLKVDHQLTSKDRIGWASTWYRSRSTSDRSQINFWWEKNYWPSNSQRVYWTRVFSPNLINEFRAGIERKDEHEGGDPDTPFPTTFVDQFNGDGLAFMKEIGLTWAPSNVGGVLQSSLPLFNIGGQNWQTGTSFGYHTGFNFRGGYDFRADTRHIADNLTWVHAKHSFKMGGDFRPSYNQTIKWGQSVMGQFDFTGRFTGHPYADFLLGLPENSLRAGVTPRPYRQQKWGGAFFQDNWRISPKLTLELGLRFEHNGLAYEKNYMMASFDPATGSIVVPNEKSLSLVSPAFPKNIPVKTAAQAGFPLLLRDRPQFHWFPRFGFAYRPFSDVKTVVRGSFGVFSVPPAWDAGGGACCSPYGSAMVTNAPFALDEAFSNSLTGGVPQFAFPDPFPLSTGSVPGQTALGVNTRFPFGYTQNWNFTVEREIIPNTALRVSYLGVKGTSLPYQSYISPTVGGVLVYPNFSRVWQVDAGANMSYQGMEASLKRRFSAGVQFEVFYSWGHKLGMPAVLRPWRETDFGDFIEDTRNRDRDRGRAPDWADQRLTISHVVELPIGRGRQWLSNVARPVDYIVGGWTISGFWWFNTWKPLNPVVSGQDPLGLGRNIRASVVPGCDPNITPNPGSIFNASCFERPPQGQYGNAAWNSILPQSWVGLGQNNVGLWKTFNLGFYETAKLRIGTKFQNIFNHPYLVPAGGSSLIGSGSVARGVMTGNRTILFEAKLEF